MDSIIMSVTLLKDTTGLKAGTILYPTVINNKEVFCCCGGTYITMDIIIRYPEFFRIDFKE